MAFSADHRDERRVKALIRAYLEDKRDELRKAVEDKKAQTIIDWDKREEAT